MQAFILHNVITQFLIIVLVIGFVNEVYAFSEPNPGTVSQTEQICIEIKTGRIASPLTIVPRWTAGTATGDWSNAMMSLFIIVYVIHV